ncbi:alginate lyase family protein [Actinopolymorpha sp. B9G3]|uniref:galactose-binding domain-containing protein n=1 Tax=Actinopolymorpha sp. B9G3 TaxID=3158970 RepID=UPI0032D8DFD1
MLVTAAQLEFVREKVAEGAEPWASAFDEMAASDLASLDREANPREIVECGSNSQPNNGCTDEREDALAAYTQALLWNLTGEEAHAQKAIEILDAWSGTLKDHTNSNAPLQAGWSGASFARAGELMKHTYGGWPADRVERFAAMLRDEHLPQVLVDRRPNHNGNWELIMLDAAVGISVFLDDRESFNTAVDIWKRRVPAYFYLESDGALPVPPPDGNKDTPESMIGYWHGQETFVDGVSQETCRNFGYVGWGFAATAHVAETARHQGIDLYGEVRERVTKALEFHAGYELGEPVPDWLCGGTKQRSMGPTLEVAYNYYHGLHGMDLPKTGEWLETSGIRPTHANYFLAWETLTHAGNPIGQRWAPDLGPAPPETTLLLDPTSNQVVEPGGSVEVTATFTVDDNSTVAVSDVLVAAELPEGWTVEGDPIRQERLEVGETATTTWTVTAPSDAPDGRLTMPVHASYRAADPNHGRETHERDRLALLVVTKPNLATAKPATQSSIGFGGVPERAVDADTNGNWSGGSVTHTTFEDQPWWQVDLGAVHEIGEIAIWNRTDCCSERLSDYHVLVSDEPFTSGSLTDVLNQPAVWSSHQTTQAGSPTRLVDLNRTGRYVRVQLTGNNALSLAEVQVFAPSS